MKLNAVEFVKKVIVDAVHVGASDIHIDPAPVASSVRFRVDGLLRHICTIPPPIHPEVIARIKILAGLRTDIHQAPQDGRFRHRDTGQTECDIRISILPTQYGENAVIRILSPPKSGSSLFDLGFTSDDSSRIESALAKRQGLILVTGPTGSGKTTTLYALIKMIDKEESSIVTLEDPIEYALDGVRQVQVNHTYGVSFSTGLRAILRQDPDIIMVGEIRDAETARIAVHSALTGHLVLSTLHTNSACATLPRLLDMGIEPYLSAATLSLVIGQRLVRELVPKQLPPKQPEEKENKEYTYKGRTGIYETLVVDDSIKKGILERLTENDIERIARDHGMRTMREDGMTKVEKDITSHTELMRVLYQ
jgi:type IV pilus assembly protein PilB